MADAQLTGSYDSLEEQDDAVSHQSIDSAPEAIGLLDELVKLLNHGTALLSGKPHDRGLNFLVGLLLVRAFNSLWRAREDAVRGYPVQSLALCRSALEDWIAVEWVEADPTRTSHWLATILPEVEQPLDSAGRPRWVPSTNQMLRDLGCRGALPRVAYEQLSKFAHPRGVGLLWQFRADGTDLNVRVGSHFDTDDLRTCLYFLVHVAAGMLPCVERLQRRWLGDFDRKWFQASHAAVTLALEYIEQVGREVASNTASGGADEELESHPGADTR